MSAQLQHPECRRRLPTIPITKTKLIDGVSSGKIRGRSGSLPVSMAFTQSQTMDALPKKRLTPEVVATLLSMDLEDHSALYRNKVQNDITSTKSKSHEKMSPHQSTRMSNLKSTSRDNVGMVEIAKSPDQPLGFSLRESNGSVNEKSGGIFVSRLTAGGVVEQNSLLRAGDEILEVNSVDVHGYKLSDVVAMIQLPKRLALMVRFLEKPYENITRTQRESKEKPIFNNNNNNICKFNKTDRGTNDNNTDAGETTRTYGQIRTYTEGALVSNAVNSRRSSDSSLRSPGRILPAPPAESEPSIHGIEDSSSSSKTDTSKISTEMSRGSVPVKDTNFMARNQKGESPIMYGATKHKNRRKSAVLPVSNETTTNSQIQVNPDGVHEKFGEVRNKRVDPGDIRFDIMSLPSDDDAAGVISRTSELKAEPTSSPVAFSSPNSSTLHTFDSSSSLSSSESPKSQYRKLFLTKPPGLTRSSRSDLSTYSSSLAVDASPVGSSSETEDQISKSTTSDRQQKPSFLLHSLSSDELTQSHNSWFSKIGNQTRKHVRKFSEGTQLRAPKGGEVYRFQDPANNPSDDVDPGYRPYPGSSGRNENRSTQRAVTGMLALHILKGCRISTGETTSKDKRKKIKVFCTVDCDGIRQACTSIKKGLDNFQWNESFEIIFQRTREINLTVCMRSKKDGDQTLTHGFLSLAQLLSEGSEHMLGMGLDPVGILYVRLHFTDMKALLQRTPSQKKEGVFGFSLEAVLRRENSKIPVLVRKCVDEINQRGLEVIGIYRLCGNAAKKRALRAEFESGSAKVDLGQSENFVDVNVITGLLKDYLRELPKPLLSEEVREILYEASTCLETHCESSVRFLVNKITGKIPSAAKDTIVFLLDHFATVLMNSDVNKMDSHNLAVCIGPVLLCPSLGATSNDTVSDTKKDISAIKLLLEIWPKPEQVSAC